MIKCKKCGKENEDNNWKCIVCEDLLHEEVQKKVIRPSNFIMLSVIIILSGIPTGIISLVYGILVNSSFNKDEYDKAKKYSKKARLWVWVSILLGLILFVIVFKYFIHLYNQFSSMSIMQMMDLLKYGNVSIFLFTYTK